MTQRLITHLRHVDLAVPDFGKQLDFYTNTWGLTAEHSDSGLAFLAAEGSPEQYVVRLREATDKRIDLISFGVATPADVDTLDQGVWDRFHARRVDRARAVVDASVQLGQWLLDHERGDVSGLMGRTAALLSTPA